MSDGNGAITLPKWFLWIMSGATGVFLAIFVPWSVYLTTSVITLNVKMDTASILAQRVDEVRQSSAENKLRIVELERRVSILEK